MVGAQPEASTLAGYLHGRVNALSERNITIRDRRSVSTRPAVSVGGQCLRDLRDLSGEKSPSPLVGEGFGVRGYTRDNQIETVSSSLQAIPFPLPKMGKTVKT